MRITRPSGLHGYHVLVAPLGRPEPTRAAAVVFITDPDAQPADFESLLAQQYGLTTREAALTRLMLTGAGLTEAAATLRVTRNTAKTHLRAVFLKTDTSRQGDLIRAVLRSPIGHVEPTSPQHLPE